MEKRQLEAYRINEQLIRRNLAKIEEEESRDIDVVYGKVKSSMAEFPYIPTHVAVQMKEPKEADKSNRRISRWKSEIDKAERQNKEVETFISSITDTRAREIFSLRYIEGKKVSEIAEEMGYTKGRISQIISSNLQVF